MYMGKRFLLILLSLFMFTGAAFAYGNPRWFKMPVSVYSPDNDAIVLNAFKSWQTASGGCVRFVFRSSANLQSRSNITVTYTDSLPDGAAYSVTRNYTIFGNTDYYVKNGYFYKTQITIAKNGGEENKPFSKSELRAIALRAVGEAIGVKPLNSSNSVMSAETDYSQTSLSANDVRAVNKLYRP